MLIGKFGLVLGRTNLDDLFDWVADLIGGVFLGDLTVLGVDLDGVLDLALLALLDNLSLSRLQVRVDTDLGLEWSLLIPLDLRGGRLALSTDLDDLIDRLGHTLGFGLGIYDLRVLDGQRRGDLVLTELAFLDSLLLTRFHRVIEDDRGFEWHILDILTGVSAFRLSAHADDLLDRLLGALSRHSRIAVRLAVDDLLSRGHNLGAKFTLLVNLLFALLERVVEDDLSLERNRLLYLGHHRGVLGCRTILDDLVNRSLGLLLLRGDRCLVTLGSEVSGVGLLARHALLDDLDLTRLQLRVRTGNNLERNLSSPGDLRGSLRRLGTNLDDLINRLLGNLLGDLRVARLRVDDLARDRHRLLTRNTLGHNLRLTGRQVRIEFDLHTERNLRLNGLSVGAGGLGANADDLLGRLLRALRCHDRVARRLSVHELLSRGLNFGTNLTLLVNNLLAGFEGVVEDHLGVERNRLLSLGHQLARSNARAVLDDPLDRLLGGLFLDDLSLIARSGELSGEGLLTVLTFLNNPGFTRLQVRVLANLGRVRNRNRPRDFLGALGRLGADDDDLVDRCLGLIPGAVLVHLLFARHTRSLNLVGTGRDGVVVLVLDLERNLPLRNVDDVDRCGGVVLRAVLVGHDDRNVDLVARLRGLRRGGDYVALVIQADDPVAVSRLHLVGGVAEFVVLTGGFEALRVDHERLVRIKVDLCRLLDANRRGRRATRVDRLGRNNRLRLPGVGQLDHGGNRCLSRQTTWGVNGYRDGVLVTWLSIGRRGGGNFTGLRVNGVLPAVDFLRKNRLAVLSTKGESRAVRRVFNLVLHCLARSGGLDVVVRLDVALDNDDSADNRLRLLLAFIAVVSLDRNVQDVAFLRTLRDRGRNLTSLLVNVDGPRLAILASKGGLVGAILEGVARRGFIGRVAAQTALRDFGSEADARVRLTSHCVVGRDLDVHDRLELDLDLIRGLVRVGCLHLRGDDGSRCNRVVCFRGDLAGVIDGDGPAIRHSRLVDLELGRVDRLMALHDGLGTHLNGDVLIQLALRQTRAHQVSDLGVVRVNNHEQLKLISGAVGVFNDDLRASEGARLRLFRSGDSDVVVFVHLDGPAVVHVLLIQLNLGFEAVITLLLCQVLDQVRGLGEGDLLRLGSNRPSSTIDAGDDRSIRLVVLRGVVLGVIKGERLRVDDVCLVVASQRVGAVEGSAFPEVVVLGSRLELVHATRLCQNGEVHVLVSCQVGTAVLRPGEEDFAGRFVDTQVLRTAGCGRVRGADERAVAIVSLHDHAGHRVVSATVLHSRNIDLTDLGFLTGDDDVLFEVLPRHRDRVTFDVLARPRVHDGRKACRFSPGGPSPWVGIFLLIVTLPGVTYRVGGGGLSELLDFLVSQFRVEI